MQKNRGIVCEKHKNHIIFLTENGEFLKGIPLIANPEIGDEVDFYLRTTSLLTFSNKSIFYRLGPALLAAILCIFIATSLLMPDKSVAAYIQVSGNQPVEIGVNEKGKVISVEAQSNENIHLKDIEGLPIEKALSKVVNELYTEEAEVSISAEYNKDTLPGLKEQIEIAVKKAQQDQTNKKLDSTEKPSNEESKQKNNRLDVTNEKANQNPPGKEAPNANVNKTQQNSTVKDVKNNSQKNSNAQQEIPKIVPKQEKTANPSTEKSNSGHQEIKNEHAPRKENNNKSNRSTNKVDHSKSEKNSENK